MDCLSSWKNNGTYYLINMQKVNVIKGHTLSGGRNHSGRITCYHRGGGHKRLRRPVVFKYQTGVKAATTLPNVSYYDPRRGGLIHYSKSDGMFELATARANNHGGFGEGHGTSAKLSTLPAHTKVHSIELTSGKGGQLVRGAGCFATIVNQVGEYTRIRLPSGEERLIRGECMCCIGVVDGRSRKVWSLALHYRGLGKAGRSRWLGRRPTVRGTARNPIDHPHGGGQGKTSGGRPSVTPWSVPKGVRTSAGRGAAFVVVPRS